MNTTINIPALLDEKQEITVTEHFNAAAQLYREWSPEGHLHFGYYQIGTSPLNRKQQLEAMVDEVVTELHTDREERVADMGCGYGTAAIHIAKKKRVHVDGFTIINEQIKSGDLAKKHAGVNDLVRLHKRDFRATEMPNASYDGAYALESLCYGTGPGKDDVLSEIHRILKPGKKLCLVDGFVLAQPKRGSFAEAILNKVAKGWAVDQFAQREAFIEALYQIGFAKVKVRDLSLRVAPSAFHAPPLIVRSFLKRLLMLNPMKRKERAHLASCFWGLILGMFMKNFRYLMITTTKEEN